MSETSEQPRNPYPTADAIIVVGENEPQVVLVERANPPRGYALPGGFIDYGESAARAAEREALEETSLEVELVELFHVYADPGRDPRKHTLSTVFLARPRAPDAAARLRGGDDAAAAGLFPLSKLPPLCFDHGVILEDYRRYRETGERPPPHR